MQLEALYRHSPVRFLHLNLNYNWWTQWCLVSLVEHLLAFQQTSYLNFVSLSTKHLVAYLPQFPNIDHSVEIHLRFPIKPKLQEVNMKFQWDAKRSITTKKDEKNIQYCQLLKRPLNIWRTFLKELIKRHHSSTRHSVITLGKTCHHHQFRHFVLADKIDYLFCFFAGKRSFFKFWILHKLWNVMAVFLW